jgi:hypothetical protein
VSHSHFRVLLLDYHLPAVLVCIALEICNVITRKLGDKYNIKIT